jgi:hypothetical protein
MVFVAEQRDQRRWPRKARARRAAVLGAPKHRQNWTRRPCRLRSCVNAPAIASTPGPTSNSDSCVTRRCASAQRGSRRVKHALPRPASEAASVPSAGSAAAHTAPARTRRRGYAAACVCSLTSSLGWRKEGAEEARGDCARADLATRTDDARERALAVSAAAAHGRPAASSTPRPPPSRRNNLFWL